jgi:deoxyhypusine synthase
MQGEYISFLPGDSLAFLQDDIPVFCPALTDGSIGDMVYFHLFRSSGLAMDIVGDVRALNELARTSIKAGVVILGGGVCKHQIADAMLTVRITFLLEPASLTAA